MLVWAAFAVMTTAAVVFLLRPLMRRRGEASRRADHASAVYRDQLDEIGRDLERGVLSETEADSARAEIARRLLATDAEGRNAQSDTGRGQSWDRAAVPLIVLAVPAIALGVYIATGQPNLPAQPFAQRQLAPAETQDLSTLVARVERHLQAQPNDGQGWAVIGPAYMRLRRFDDAVNAFERALDLNGPSARGAAALGEARVLAADGMVDEGARSAFESALSLDAELIEPRYYLGLAALQDGDRDRAVTLWRELVDQAPPGARWAAEIQRQIEDATGGSGGSDDAAAPPAVADGTAPRVDRETMEAAGQMDAEERQAMIEGMVAGLDQRLSDDGGSVDEWLRLIRAYMVLGRRDDALAALERARDGLKDDPTAAARLADSVKSMGIGS